MRMRMSLMVCMKLGQGGLHRLALILIALQVQAGHQRLVKKENI
jgi:hypothetical protein